MMPIIQWPAFMGDGRADRVEAHVWTQTKDAPWDPIRWLYVCGPTGAAEQIREPATTRCREITPVPDQFAKDYSHCFEFHDGAPDDVDDFVALLGDARTLYPRAQVDHALVLDWYKIPEEGVDARQWANTESGALLAGSKYSHNLERARENARELSRRMANVVTRHPILRDATILSVPGSNNDGKSFGEALANEVAKRAGLPVVRTLAGEGHVPRKNGGGAVSLIGTFTLSQRIAGVALVIDDVIWTGNSISATALAAREAGAAHVYALAAVKTMKGW